MNWSLVFLTGFLLVYLGATLGLVGWMRWRRKTKWPFKESDRLLRGPGESLRRRIAQLDERVVFEILGALVVGAVAAPLLGLLAKKLAAQSGVILTVMVAGTVAAAAIGAWRMYRLFRERAHYYLGWYGERMVAEKLQALLGEGYRAFHDVPGEPGARSFNLDHVVVGATGVVVIEVKSRRKGNARPGYADHEVSFDGTQLDWPWSYDRQPIEQASNQADWLRKLIEQRTGLRVPVRAIVALPGWYVREKGQGVVRVVNPSFLPAAIRGRNEAVLSPKEVDLLSRQFDQLCRDVDD